MTSDSLLSIAKHPDFDGIVRAASEVGLAMCVPHMCDATGLKPLRPGLVRMESNLQISIVNAGDPSVRFAKPVAWCWEQRAATEGGPLREQGKLTVVAGCCERREQPPKPSPRPDPDNPRGSALAVPLSLLRAAAQLGLGLCVPHTHTEDGAIAPLPDGTMALEQDARVRFVSRRWADSRRNEWIATSWRLEPGGTHSQCGDRSEPRSRWQPVPIYGVLLSA